MENVTRKEKEKKQHKKSIIKIYTMQNIKRLVYCHCMEYSTRSNILSEVHSSEKNMNLRYFLSSLIFSRNVRPHYFVYRQYTWTFLLFNLYFNSACLCSIQCLLLIQLLISWTEMSWLLKPTIWWPITIKFNDRPINRIIPIGAILSVTSPHAFS